MNDTGIRVEALLFIQSDSSLTHKPVIQKTGSSIVLHEQGLYHQKDSVKTSELSSHSILNCCETTVSTQTAVLSRHTS